MLTASLKYFLTLLLVVVITFFSYGRIRSLNEEIAIEHLPAFPTKTLKESIRFAAFNIAHGRGPVLGQSNWTGSVEEKKQRIQKIASFLKDSDIDVVILNEVDFNTYWSGGIDQASAIASAGEFPYIARQINYDLLLPGFTIQFGNALLSRFPIQSARKETLAPLNVIETWFYGNHDALEAEILLSNNLVVNFWGLHLEVRNEETRIEAVKQVQRKINREIPTIIAGDLNSQPAQASNSTALSTLLDSVNFSSFPKTSNQLATFPAENPDRTIDWILYSQHWVLTDSLVASAKYSDHLPVIANLKIK